MLGLSKVLCGLVVSLALALAGRIEAGYSPAYFVNTQSSSRVGQHIDADVVPALVSHFLGDNSAAADSADAEAVIAEFPSRFMDATKSAVVLVENFDTNSLESTFGSASLYLADEGLDSLRARASPVNARFLAEALELNPSVLFLSAQEASKDHVESVLESVLRTSAKVMLVSVPSHEGAKNADGFALRNMFATTENKTEYVKIPSSFASEDACIAQTNACSQRGSCVKSSAGRWACQCVATKDGDYTSYWGGSDCSKRDVSFQFNLLVGTTLAIVVAATLSVVLLFNLGKENGVPDTVKL